MMRSSNRALLAITGRGCIGAPGAGLAAQRRALADGWCGLSIAADGLLPLGATLPVGRVRERLPPLPGRTAALALVAAREALAEAGLGRDDLADAALVVGSSTAGMSESERDFLSERALGEKGRSEGALGSGAAQAFPSYRRQQSHRITSMVAHVLGCKGVQSTHSVACASAACAIIEAAELVRSGMCPIAVAIGCDALTRLTMAGFTSLQLVDPQGCRPLTVERSGMSLGEGAAALVIEDAAHARNRGARALATLAGWGLHADAYHITTPHPDGSQLQAAIGDALADAGMAATEIGYVSAHGTGTPDNDVCEARVLGRVFGAIPTASCKRTYGHTLGASAAVEAVACCLALEDGTIYASAGADLGTPLAGVEVVRVSRSARLDAVCSTTLAFGGVNAALIFARGERCA